MMNEKKKKERKNEQMNANEWKHTGKVPAIIKKSDKHLLLAEFYSNVGEDIQENKCNNYRDDVHQSTP